MVDYFGRQGIPIVATDRRAPGTQHPGSIAWMQGDLADPDFAAQLPRDIAGVIHAAGTSRSSIAAKDPVECIRSSVLGTAQLLAAVSPSSPWFLLVSSRMVSELEARQEEGDGPVDVYAVAKQAAETLLRHYARSGPGFRYVIARLSDVYGSASDHPDKLLPSLIRCAREGRPLVVKDPAARFYFVHIEDVLAKLAAAVDDLQNPVPGSFATVRDVWSGPGTTMGELALLVKTVCGSASAVVTADPTGSGPAPRAPVGGPKRAASDWNFQPTIELEAGLRRVVAEAG